MKKGIRLFATLMVCMAMALCMSCKKDNDNEPGGGTGVTGDGNGTIYPHEYVDLGLPSGLLWATCNVGADSPEDYGDYFAWGETTTKSTYDWSTYKWCNGGDHHKLTKYNTKSSYGTVDDKTVLELEDDAARANWDGAWRMPTYDEMVELKNNCTWKWITQDGKKGYLVTGSNGNNIFLPAAGCYYNGSLYDDDYYCIYWSSSLYTGGPDLACTLYSYSGSVYMDNANRSFGRTVRPVRNSQ